MRRVFPAPPHLGPRLRPCADHPDRRADRVVRVAVEHAGEPARRRGSRRSALEHAGVQVGVGHRHAAAECPLPARAVDLQRRRAVGLDRLRLGQELPPAHAARARLARRPARPGRARRARRSLRPARAGVPLLPLRPRPVLRARQTTGTSRPRRAAGACPGRGCFESFTPPSAAAEPARFAYPAVLAKNGTFDPTACPTGVEPNSATVSAVAERTSARRLIARPPPPRCAWRPSPATSRGSRPGPRRCRRASARGDEIREQLSAPPSPTASNAFSVGP